MRSSSIPVNVSRAISRGLTAASTRLSAFVRARSEWCISRQRSWGVPIPALYDDNGPLLDAEVIRHVIDVIDSRGVDSWFSDPIETFVPPTHGHLSLRKGPDTLDVWFDSGSSWTMLGARKGPPADLYLEGSDQHRGWFQSSLLTHVLVNGPTAPFANLITHGFVTDEEGQKMSKSLGNGISPKDVIKEHGTDVLRLWAASVDYTKDASIGPAALAHAAETLRKLRSVVRYILGNVPRPDEPAILARDEKYDVVRNICFRHG